MATVAPLVSTQWLQQAVEQRRHDVIIIDVSFLFVLSGREAFEKCRIPTSRHMDLMHKVTSSREIPMGIPSADVIQQTARDLGVNNSSHVVFYDRDDGEDLITTASARARWLLMLYGHKKASVLDGGLVQWMKDGYPTESQPSGSTQVEQGDFTASLQPDLVVDFAAMQSIVDKQSHQIVDSRMPEHYSGSLPEPNLFTVLALQTCSLPLVEEKDMARGAMKGAKNLSFSSLFSKSNTKYPTKEACEQLFRGAGVDIIKPTVATCYIGFSACAVALMASLCGNDRVPVYPGSWTEWGQKTVGKSNL